MIKDKSMTDTYKHTQIGYLTIIILTISLLILFFTMIFTEFEREQFQDLEFAHHYSREREKNCFSKYP